MQLGKTPYSLNPDIQILRGLSIMLVLLYHLQIPFLKSGYLGVDIFFVISGFLMGKIYSEISSWSDTINFYKKRLNRILPAYYVTLFTTLLVSTYMVLPHELKDIMNHGVWSFFLAPNIGFWGDASYFESRYFKPFLNFWSLGVEIQFYLVFPLLIFIFKRHAWLIIIGAIASYILCFYVAGVSPKTSFFMTPLRFWEFMAGFLMAKISMPTFKTCKSWIGLLALIGLIITAFIEFTQESHLKYAALIICMLCLLVLSLGLPNTIRNNLAGKALQGLGKYSYSIYLVHFPIIALMLYKPYSGLILKPTSWEQTGLILILITLASILMYHLIENPFRKNLLRKYWPVAYFACATIGLVITPILLQKSRSLYSFQDLKYFDAWADRSEYRCGKLRRITQPLGASCLLTGNSNKNEKSYLLIGNSYADAIKETLKKLALESKSDLRMMKDNCSLGKGACNQNSVINEIKANNIDAIILHSSAQQIKTQDVKAILSQLKEVGNVKLFYILPPPRYSFNVPKTLYELGNENIWNVYSQSSLEDYYHTVSEQKNELKEITAENFSIISLGEELCSPKCKITDENTRPLYYDAHHLTLTGAERVSPALKHIFESP